MHLLTKAIKGAGMSFPVSHQQIILASELEPIKFNSSHHHLLYVSPLPSSYSP